MSFQNPIRKFHIEDPNDGNGPLSFPTPIPTATPTPTPGPGAGYYLCPGLSCMYYNVDPGCPSCTGPVVPTVTPTPGPTSTPTPTPTLACIDFVSPQLMQASLVSFLVDRVIYYKLNLEQTQKNIYGEALEKWYWEGIQTKGIMERSPETIENEMFGPDIMQAVKLSLPEAVLNPNNPFNIIVPINIIPEIGDVFYDIGRERYYEVHNVVMEYYPIVTNVGVTDINCPPVKILKYNLDCYLTRTSKLNLLPYKML